jgi:succinoglycan biosynthesis protein ExoA
MNQKNIISLIIPTFNEERYVEQLINNMIALEPANKEVFFVDGGSSDKTALTIQQYAAQYEKIHYVHNPEKYVSNGFNKAFSLSKGKYVALMGAHTKYPDDYLKIGLAALESNEADAVGGPLQHISNTEKGEVIAACMSSSFGVGNTEFRTSKKRMYVDSAPFAIYKKDIFDQIGLFDTQLVRNQDDEFHYRINAAGYRILMIPEMETEYVVRDSFKKLFSQYFQYGSYKPLVLKKVKSSIRLRHIIPSLFVLYLFTLPLCYWAPVWVIPLVLYIIFGFYFSGKLLKNPLQRLQAIYVFSLLHISYGLGFLFGLFKKNEALR